LFHFDGVLPLDGATGVSPWAPLAFTLRCEADEGWAEIVREASCAHLPVYGASVELLREGDSAPVNGQLRSYGGRLVFVPDAPLAPETEYVYRVSLPGLGGATGAALEGGFRTGSAALDALRADDLPAPELVTYQGSAAKCEGEDGHEVRLTGQAADDALAPAICPSGLSCVADGTGVARRFVVQLSGVEGGYAPLGYEAELEVSFRAAANSGPVGMQGVHVGAGESDTLALDLPELDADAEVCARVRVRDARGSELSREACAPYQELNAAAPVADRDTENVREDDPPRGQGADAVRVAGCSLGATPSSRSAPAALLLAALFAILRLRRRPRA
jgi:MYXO-CTERM domain-containing protein